MLSLLMVWVGGVLACRYAGDEKRVPTWLEAGLWPLAAVGTVWERWERRR